MSEKINVGDIVRVTWGDRSHARRVEYIFNSTYAVLTYVELETMKVDLNNVSFAPLSELELYSSYISGIVKGYENEIQKYKSTISDLQNHIKLFHQNEK